jgi:hypothetical protein
MSKEIVPKNPIKINLNRSIANYSK